MQVRVPAGKRANRTTASRWSQVLGESLAAQVCPHKWEARHRNEKRHLLRGYSWTCGTRSRFPPGGNYRHGITAGTCLWRVDYRHPNRAFDHQFGARVVGPLESTQLTLAQPREGAGSNQTLFEKRKTVGDLQNLVEPISRCFAWFFSIPGNQNPIDRVDPIEGSFLLGIEENGPQTL